MPADGLLSPVAHAAPEPGATTVMQLVPDVREVAVADVLRRLHGAPRTHGAPFDPLRVDFSDAVSRAIFGLPEARAFPELVALAFFLRRSAVQRLGERFAAVEAAGSTRAARGVVFHLPPTNVDTIFVYSLMVSLVVGNLNVVRVSRDRPTEQIALLCDVLRRVIADERFASFADELAIISYGHEPEPTAALSKAVDARLLWGGDETVERMRAFPVGPATHDLAFGDRFSFAAARPEAVLAADPAQLRTLAEQLYNDVYWFDQLGCASPRLLVWVGARDQAGAAHDALFAELEAVVADRRYQLEPATAIAKLAFTYGALIDRPVARVHQAGNELVVLTLEGLRGFDRTHPGAGLLFEAHVDELSELAAFVVRKDQTLTVHGFEQDELTAFARSLRGRGIDRIVPFGDALTFGSLWDGYDLLAELTRTIHIA